MVGTPRARGKGSGTTKMAPGQAAKKGKGKGPQRLRWPSSSALLDTVLTKKGREALSGPNPKAVLNSLTRVAIAMGTPVKPNQDGFRLMYLRLIGHDPSKPVKSESFNTILATLTYSWHDTDPWAILGKSIWEGTEVGIDTAFYEFHRELSRLYTWNKHGQTGKIAPWTFPTEFLKPVVEVFRQRVLGLRIQHMGLHIAKAQMREHLRKLQVEVVGPELMRAYREAGKPLPPWMSSDRVGLARVYEFMEQHIPEGTELIIPSVPMSEEENEDDDDDDVIEDEDTIDDDSLEAEKAPAEAGGQGVEIEAGVGAELKVGQEALESGEGEGGPPLSALDLLVKTATASESVSGASECSFLAPS